MSKARRSRVRGDDAHAHDRDSLPPLLTSTKESHDASRRKRRTREGTQTAHPLSSQPPASASLQGPQKNGTGKNGNRDETPAHLPLLLTSPESVPDTARSRSRRQAAPKQPDVSDIQTSASRQERHAATRKKSSSRKDGPTNPPSPLLTILQTSLEEPTDPSRRKRRIQDPPRTEQPPASFSLAPTSPKGAHEATSRDYVIAGKSLTKQTPSPTRPSSTPPEPRQDLGKRESRTGEKASTYQPPTFLPQTSTSHEGQAQTTGTRKSDIPEEALIDQKPAFLTRSQLYPTSPEAPRDTGSPVGHLRGGTLLDEPRSTFPRSPVSPEGPQEAAPTATAGATVTATISAPFASPLDHILIFGHGRYQRRVLLCTTFAFFTTIVHAAASDDLARPVDHWCKTPPEYSSLSPETWKNVSVPLEADGETHSHCFRFQPPLSIEVDGAGNRTVVPCDYGWDYDLGSGLRSIVSEWDLVCGRSWIKTLLATAYMLGGVIGAPIAGIAADSIGRRPVLVISVFLLMVAGNALPSVLTLAAFAILRFVLSAAAASSLVTSLVLLFEVTDTQHRVPFCGLAVAAATLSASIYKELIYDLIHDWKIAQIAYMVPSCGLVLVVYVMDESPCLILATSDLSRAERVLSWAALVNGIEPDEFKRRLQTLRDSLEKKHVTAGHQGGGVGTVHQEQDVNVTNLMANRMLRQRSAVIFGCWLLTFGVYFSLSGGQFLQQDRVARLALVLLRVPGVIGDVYILGRAGRRLSLAYGMLALSAGTAAFAAALVFGAHASLIKALVVLNVVIFDLSAVTVFAFSSELYPTVVRGAGVALCYTCGRIGALVALFLNDIQSLPYKGVLYAVYSVPLLAFGLLAKRLPETRQLQPGNTLRGMAVPSTPRTPR